METQLPERRKERLKALIAEKFHGEAASLGRALGYKDGAFIGHMVTGHRAITEKTIAKIHKIHGCDGWFNEALFATGSASFGFAATGTAEAMPATPPAGTIDHAYGSYTRILRFADFIKHLDDDDREVLALRFASLIRKPEQAERYAVEIERLLGGVGKSQAGASMSSDSKSASAKS